MFHIWLSRQLAKGLSSLSSPHLFIPQAVGQRAQHGDGRRVEDRCDRVLSLCSTWRASLSLQVGMVPETRRVRVRGEAPGQSLLL